MVREETALRLNGALKERLPTQRKLNRNTTEVKHIAFQMKIMYIEYAKLLIKPHCNSSKN